MGKRFKDNIWVANKCIKRCLTSLAIREMQLKLQIPSQPIGMAKNKTKRHHHKSDNVSLFVLRMQNNCNSHMLLVGM